MGTELGQELAVEGANRAAAHAGEEWQEEAYTLLVRYCKLKRIGRLTSEDARRYASLKGLVDPPDKRAWGAVMMRAKKEGVIRKAGWTTANDPKVHNNPVSLWEIVA